jgi:hypothetical protein
MNKPDALRTTLLAQVAHLREHPETLSIFIDNGRLAARATGSLSFEYRYKLNFVVQDFAGDLDLIIVPLLAWVAVNQPDLLERAPGEPFTFESEFLDAGSQDVSIDLELTELVRVSTVAGGLSVEHLPEPARLNAFPDMGETVVTLWQAAAYDIARGDAVIVPENSIA